MYQLPQLPYAYDALAPVISEDIMKLHHQKHHQAYVDKLNAVLVTEPELQKRELVDLLEHVDELPKSVAMAIRNQGGGHYNHSLFWQCMTPHASNGPSGKLAEAIDERWGSFDAFVDAFNTKALSLFGSGWVWLTHDLEILALPNQDNPMMYGKGEPLMGLDVWEHAYYLDYRNRRDEYIKNWWRVVDWTFIVTRY